ncbi:unnamed protein product [Gongylonema pulchrum]|uniref:TPR_REGION domain-containing protein n=1 Tax=Gongylonema pulchrum TaxID=637853 RepID=A0A183DZD5_9BILA|nr:unnamed protein product [Gongylonema pulchrum]
MESKGELRAARLYYQYAKDYLSVVRLLCYTEAIDEAVEIANSSGDKAACYHLGQYFEAHGDPHAAVTFFTKARACSNALRLAKEYNMKDKIANLALMAGGNELVEAARYYESVPGQADKAVMLYHKASSLTCCRLKALKKLAPMSFHDAKNERLWFKTNTKLGKLYFDQKEFTKLDRIIKQLRNSCKVSPYKSMCCAIE